MTWGVTLGLTLLATGAVGTLLEGVAVAQCNVCTTCQADGDCGAGYVCRDLGVPTGKRCTQLCATRECAGDSICYTFTYSGNTEKICLNPDAGTAGSCPASYTCTDDGLACSGLGTNCATGPAACSLLEANTCLTSTDAQGNSRSYCTCSCASSGDCDGAACSAAGGGNLCQAGVAPGLCDGVTCPSGQTCNQGNGQCINLGTGDLCENITCAPPAICSPATGTCVGGATDTNPGTDTAPSDTGSATDTAAGTDTHVGSDTYSAVDSGPGSDTGAGTDTYVPPGVFMLRSISPAMGSNQLQQTVRVEGSGFVAGMALRLDATPLSEVVVSSATVANATVPPGMTPGTYGLHGQLPSGELYSLPAVYQVTGPGGGDVGGGGTGDDEGCACAVRRTDRDFTPSGALLALLVGLCVVVSGRRRARS